MSRKKNDFYITPQGLIRALISTVDVGGNILECCAGDGAIAKLLPGQVFTNDIDYVHNADMQYDVTDSDIWFAMDTYCQGIDWVVTNPPFSSAQDIIPHALAHSQIGIAMLLRLTYLEPTFKRGNWLSSYAPLMSNMIIFGSPRPSFTKKGTDSATVAWLVWKHGHEGGTKITFCTNWKDKR